MKKVLTTVLGASILLAGCGSQNLGPLEHKTTKLREENHQLKLDNQELDRKISDLNEKEKSLTADKKNTKEAAVNELKTKSAKASSKYYQQITQTLNDYHNIKSEINKNKRNEKIVSKLDKIVTDIQSAHDKYKLDREQGEMSDSDKADDKNIQNLNNNLVKSFKSIRDGYSEKDKKKINQGQNQLSQINVKNPQS
ncbi:hypothetical protein [Staphylococcus carnosus]|uniref:Lipoprotein n=1 Tax=Staphylococcus carnosus (strain TM300) TaxID=396513 RepID=B9DNQ6_STACT|nr:hypothetical protein [Staphylococcus carnosus]KOR13577.1 hypothetical protein AMC75_01515 [Staphylococcus carnosus]QPT04189.1 hypothetical protein I6G40_01610 [Staphylococcus carnosus]UQA66914.1 hypothetical protein Sta3580_10265 [Staphylococcus carnosus]UTB87794.1 hypothetical protein A2I63_06670 [Staphylococcus carnosus]CAL28062.1 hypothetical protein SCA_1154 [Staphylococcus carnosus subsp. carnosus TM300]